MAKLHFQHHDTSFQCQVPLFIININALFNIFVETVHLFHDSLINKYNILNIKNIFAFAFNQFNAYFIIKSVYIYIYIYIYIYFI